MLKDVINKFTVLTISEAFLFSLIALEEKEKKSRCQWGFTSHELIEYKIFFPLSLQAKKCWFFKNQTANHPGIAGASFRRWKSQGWALAAAWCHCSYSTPITCSKFHFFSANPREIHWVGGKGKPEGKKKKKKIILCPESHFVTTQTSLNLLILTI